VKHKFLLDVMVVYHAVERVDQYGNADETAADLVRLIGENCHTVLVDKVLAEKYDLHLRKLLGRPWLLE
jgi:hypothetical protein